MAFTPKKLNNTDINKGNPYIDNQDSPQADAFNRIIQGILWNNENGGGSTENIEIEEGGGLAFDGTTGKLQLQEEYLTYLKKQTYAKPTISSFKLKGADETYYDETYYAVGDSITVTGIDYNVSNVVNVRGDLTFTIDNKEIRNNINPLLGTANLSINETQTSDKEKTVSYVLSGKDTNGNTFSMSIDKYFVYPFYYGGYSSDSILTTDFDKIETIKQYSLTNAKTINITVTLKTAQYIHILTPKTIKEIKNTNTNFGVDYEKRQGTISTGGISYYDYCTVKLSAGTYNFTVTLE